MRTYGLETDITCAEGVSPNDELVGLEIVCRRSREREVRVPIKVQHRRGRDDGDETWSTPEKA